VTECQAALIGSQYDYTVLEVADTMGTVRLIAPDGTPDWDAATPEQRSTYMYISDELGLMGDGSAAPTVS
jgi:hypothetical protein